MLAHELRGAVGGGGAVKYIGSATGQNGSVTSLVINKPTGTLQGDLMIAFLINDPAKSVTASLTGWTSQDSPVNSNNASGAAVQVLTKTAGASEGSSYTFSLNNSVWMSGFIMTVRGAQFGYLGTWSTSTTTTVTAPAFYMDAAGLGVAVFYDGSNSSRTYTTPSGFTSFASDSDTSKPSFSAFYKSGGVGEFPAASSTASETNSYGVMFSVYPSGYTKPTADIAFVSSSWADNGGSGTSLFINKPTSVSTGNLLVSVVAAANSAVTWSGPSGWTEVADQNATISSLRVAYKVATSSEATTYTFTSSASSSTSGVILNFSNATYDSIGSFTVAASSPSDFTSVSYSAVTGNKYWMILCCAAPLTASALFETSSTQPGPVISANLLQKTVSASPDVTVFGNAVPSQASGSGLVRYYRSDGAAFYRFAAIYLQLKPA